MIIRLKVFEQTLSIVDTKSVPRKGSKDYLVLQFMFSSDWKDLNKLCYLQKGEVSQPIDVVNNIVKVPEWFTQQDHFYITLFGKNDNQEVPTNVVPLRLDKSNTLWEKDAPEPQPSWIVKLIDLNNHPPVPGNNGYWMLWDTDSGAYVESALSLPAVGGTSDHSNLINRDAADQHPMSAVTGLVEALEGKQLAGMGITGATVGQIAKITAVDDNGKPTAWEAVDMPSGGAVYVLTLSTYAADAQANSDAVTAAIVEHKHVVLKPGDYPVKPGIVIESGKLDMNGAHFYTVDYKSSTPLVYLKGEAPEICHGELEGSYDLADNEEGYEFFEKESLISPQGVNGAYIHHMAMHHNWGYCISPGENAERVYAETATETGKNEYRFTTEAFDIPQGYKYVTAAGGIGYNYIISISDVVYRFYDENGTEITKKSGVPRKRITIPSGAKTVTFDTKPGGDTHVPYYAYFTNYEETLTVADCTFHNFHSLAMANFPGPTTVTRCAFIEGGKPRSDVYGTFRATTGGIDIEDVQTPEFVMSDCYSRDCAKLLMFGGYKGTVMNCFGDNISIYRGWNCDLSNCNVTELSVDDRGCRVSTNGVHANALSAYGNAMYNVRGNISINGIPKSADISPELLSHFDSFIVRIENSSSTNGAIAGRLNGRIECTGDSGYRGDGISSEKGSRLEMDVGVSDSARNFYGAVSVNGETYGLVANAAFFPQGYTIHDSTFNIAAATTPYSTKDGMLDGGFENCVFNLTGAAYFRKFTGTLTVPISLTFENCVINNADNYLFNYVPDAGGVVTFKNCTIADESKLFNGDASSMTVNILTGGEGGVDIDASLTVEGAAADAKAVGDALAAAKSDLYPLPLIATVTLTEDTHTMNVTTTDAGEPLALTQMVYIEGEIMPAAENPTDYINVKLGGMKNSSNKNIKTDGTTYFEYTAEHIAPGRYNVMMVTKTGQYGAPNALGAGVNAVLLENWHGYSGEIPDVLSSITIMTNGSTSVFFGAGTTFRIYGR